MLLNPLLRGRSVSARLWLASLATIFMLSGLTADAQTIVNPRAIRFRASTDHYAVNANQQPVVSAYRLEIYVSGGLQPSASRIPE